MSELQRVALGARPADLVVRGGRVFVPETATYEERDVLVCGERIAGLRAERDADENGSDAIGPETEVVDAGGGVVVPGFVDAHTHLDTFQAFERSYVRALTGGTTTVVSETDRFAARFGAAGIEEFLAATADLPVRVYATLPPSPFYRGVAGEYPLDVDREAIVALASDDRVAGVGEVFWSRVLDLAEDAPIRTLLAAVRDAGGVVWGHGAGCHDDKLSAFAAVVDNDHEVLAPGDVTERVRRGVAPIGRYGSIRDDVDALASASETVLTAEVCLCSDGMWPAELLAEGYMDRVVRRVIEAGIDPKIAFRMATLNAARAAGLDGVGSFAPGAFADLVVLSDERRVTVDTVVAGGSVVVRGGEPLVGDRPHEYPDEYSETIRVDVDAARFRVPAGGDGDDEGTVRAMEYAGGLLSKETRVEPDVVGDEFAASPERDVLKAALLPSRAGAPDDGFTGFVTGLGLREGAVATSETWSRPGVLAVGADGESMVRAAERVAELGGGWVVVRRGEPAAELPTPVAGVCSDAPVETTNERGERVVSALVEQGLSVEQPFLAIGTLSAVGMPWFKLGFGGYVDVVANEVVGLRP
jgi:adenine deaminase